jgi:hypothetical protein
LYGRDHEGRVVRSAAWQFTCAPSESSRKSWLMETLKNFLQKYPEMAIFLKLALRFFIGKQNEE